MKTLIIATLAVLTLTACQEDYLFYPGRSDEFINPLISEIQFTDSIANSSSDSVYDFRSTNVQEKRSGWLSWDDRLDLMREIIFQNSIAGTPSLEVSLWMRKVDEDSTLLLLQDRDSYYWERNWDYLLYEDEVKNFYQDNSDTRLDINGKVLFSGEASPNGGADSSAIRVVSSRKVMVDGVEKTWVEIHFEGDAFGGYDYYKEYEGYVVRDGLFRGIIE